MSEPPWPVPADLVDRWREDQESSAWLSVVPDRARALAARWQLHPDGPPRSGYNSAVWPVRDRHRAPLMLKLTRPGVDTGPEAVALRHWSGTGGAARLHAADPGDNALLLERLDATRVLEHHHDIDEACLTIGRLLAAVHAAARAPRPDDLPTTADEAVRMTANITGDRTADVRGGRWASAGSLPAAAVDRALATFATLSAPAPDDRLLHFDAHFLNVLHTLEPSPESPAAGWRLIDPLPATGPVEWELVAMLRNRWADAAATGDPDRALRRRVDQVAGLLGAEPARCRAVAQAVAVDNLAWLLAHDPRHPFVPPYTVIAGWRD